jgi:hypothetical protein
MHTACKTHNTAQTAIHVVWSRDQTSAHLLVSKCRHVSNYQRRRPVFPSQTPQSALPDADAQTCTPTAGLRVAATRKDLPGQLPASLCWDAYPTRRDVASRPAHNTPNYWSEAGQASDPPPIAGSHGTDTEGSN